ncbi:hypothetical protein E4526_16390 [Escherichia coli]|nr:hypothetical protein [Salmonella enterica]EEA9097044.1 hypothetical protein [Salmonella enterica subsp. enterica]EEU9452084.1 hypothetical protein [Escherichia coli]MCI5413832.1 hypothetical protein [Escherichia coli]HAH5015935.1 hypothetical protein [Escherichia coli]
MIIKRHRSFPERRLDCQLPTFLPNGRYGGHELWCSQKKITISEMPVESRYADIVKRIHKRMPVNTFVILNEIFIQK